MKERPILFNGEMVRAILDGRKTQTRRIIKAPVLCNHEYRWKWNQNGEFYRFDTDNYPEVAGGFDIRCPYGQPGDRLWVRETWAMSGYERVEYRAFPADGTDFRSVSKWKPSIHMPRKYSRISLLVKDNRVERVQDISVEDIIAEGLSTTLRDHDACCHLKEQFQLLWDSISEKRVYGWSKNPWVWVVEFEVE
jgi:hypothetical protein